MHIPHTCLSCGFPIGNVAEAYRFLLVRLEKKAHQREGVPPGGLLRSGEVTVGTLLDRLGVRNDCCRSHLMGAMVFSDYR